jgi:hypothetical protein
LDYPFHPISDILRSAKCRGHSKPKENVIQLLAGGRQLGFAEVDYFFATIWLLSVPATLALVRHSLSEATVFDYVREGHPHQASASLCRGAFTQEKLYSIKPGIRREPLDDGKNESPSGDYDTMVSGSNHIPHLNSLNQ